MEKLSAQTFIDDVLFLSHQGSISPTNIFTEEFNIRLTKACHEKVNI